MWGDNSSQGFPMTPAALEELFFLANDVLLHGESAAYLANMMCPRDCFSWTMQIRRRSAEERKCDSLRRPRPPRPRSSFPQLGFPAAPGDTPAALTLQSFALHTPARHPRAPTRRKAPGESNIRGVPKIAWIRWIFFFASIYTCPMFHWDVDIDTRC